MDINTFGMEVIAEIGKVVGPEYRMNILECPDNNGLIKHGLCIMTGRVNRTPCIYLDELYGRYIYGKMSISEIAEEVLQAYREDFSENDWDTTSFTDYNRAKKNLRFHLVNTEKNRKLLKAVPHREFLDLSLTYAVEFTCEKEKGFASIQVKNEHIARLWNVDEEQLFRQAMENMLSHNEYLLESIETVIEGTDCTVDSLFDNEDAVPMYVLGNRNRLNGAVQMVNQEALRAASEILGQDFMIIPSSVHEVLLLPAREDTEGVEGLVQVIREVNKTQLALNEILSYHVYRYNGQTGEVSIAI